MGETDIEKTRKGIEAEDSGERPRKKKQGETGIEKTRRGMEVRRFKEERRR